MADIHTTETPKSAPILGDGYADQYIQRRVCARCYGDLQKVPTKDRRWEIVCPKCGDAWHYTTVSRAYAIRLGQRNLAELWDVKANLPDLFPVHSGKSEEELLHELGF